MINKRMRLSFAAIGASVHCDPLGERKKERNNAAIN
jgi:hypothetical protein